MASPRPRTPRRRALAAPFVVTAALGAGCGGPPAATPPAQPESVATSDAAPVEATRPPDAAPEPPPEAAPPGKGAWYHQITSQGAYGETPTYGTWIYSYDDGNRAVLMPGGTCLFEPGCGKRGPEVVPSTCNPPSPWEVYCPPGLPDGATAPKPPE